jgi:TolB protein
MRRPTFLMLGIAALLAAQTTGPVGIFESESDVGSPAIKGSAAFDPARKEYQVTGAGLNMWAKTDEFHFVWKRLSGDISLTATMHFVGTSAEPHRKAGLMIRKSLEPGSPYVDAVVHGDGLTSLQVRDVADDITRGFRFPVLAPARIRLERKGNIYSLWQGKDGEPLQEAGSVQFGLGADPVYVGLFVCSHNPKVVETATFSDVSLENSPKASSPK